MNLIEILFILTIHWFADFVCQTDEQAKGKSKYWKPLLTHTIIYSTVFSFFLLLFTFDLWLVLNFWLITFFFHTLTDYITSRINSKLWEQKKVHEFFVSVGFDQLLHYIQLFLTYNLLK